MLYIVQFEDKPDMGELRDKLLKSHFEFLDRVSDGYWCRVPCARYRATSPWVACGLSTPRTRRTSANFKDDPFWTNGMRASVRINRWVKAFPDRKVPI